MRESPVAYETGAPEIVTPYDPVAEGTSLLCALIVTAVAGALAGAVYNPLAETVPSAVLPPVTPFTIHVTFWLAPVTAAEYCPVAPNSTFAGPVTTTVAGTTATLNDPLAVPDSALTALIVTALAGANAGAVYKPPAEIVPVDNVPPATPFTIHVTD